MLNNGCAGKVRVHTTQHQRIGTGLAQAIAAAHRTRQLQLAAATAFDGRVGAQHHRIGNHEATGAVLLDDRRNPRQHDGIPNQGLRRRCTAIQNNLLARQTDEIIARRVARAAGATKRQDHISL